MNSYQALAFFIVLFHCEAFLCPLSAISQPPTQGHTNFKMTLVPHFKDTVLPPAIVSNKPGTWSYDTMNHRVRESILKRIYEENDLSTPEMKEAKEGVDALIKDMETPAQSKVRPIEEDGGPEVGDWNRLMEPYFGMNWLDTPWLYAEFYLYRRLLEGTGYFKNGFDPFELQKMMGVESAMESIEALSAQLLEAGSSTLSVEDGLKVYISTALWGNRMDLSLWPVKKGEQLSNSGVFEQVLSAGAANLLADHGDDVVASLLELKEAGPTDSRVDIIVDNAGFELFCDMCLADYLMESGVTTQVVIQLKGHPTFVSDAMAKDLTKMVNYLSDAPATKYPSAVAIGEKWKRRIDSGQWVLKEDFFWVQPCPFWEMPQRLVDEFRGKSYMAFVKGDANYRRLLGDRLWDLTIPFADVCGYFPTRLVALRTLKAELGCGMLKNKVEAAAASDSNWMVNGKYGVIQMFDPSAASSDLQDASTG